MMALLRGRARAEALDDLAELTYVGFCTGMPAELMADEIGIRFNGLIDAKTLECGIRLAQHRYIREYGVQPPQVEYVRQAEPLKQVWPPESASMT